MIRKIKKDSNVNPKPNLRIKHTNMIELDSDAIDDESSDDSDQQEYIKANTKSQKLI